MSAEFNQNRPDSELDFQSFLHALSSGQGQPGAPASKQPQIRPPFPQKKPGDVPATNPLTGPVAGPGLRRNDPNSQQPVQSLKIQPNQQVPPKVSFGSREVKRTVPSGVGEDADYLMGTRERPHQASFGSDTAFLPREDGIQAPQQPAAPAKPTLPASFKLKKDPPADAHQDRTPETSVFPQEKETSILGAGKKDDKIALSHISIRPQFTLEQLFETMIREKASDLHVATGCVPALRINGEVIPMELPDLKDEMTENLLLPILNEEQRVMFEEEGEIDFSFDYFDKARFRINYYRHHWGIGAAFRFIPIHVPRLNHLGISQSVKNMLKSKKGLILVAGPSSSGKTTTIASMLDELNQTQKLRIVTLEKPVEYVIRSNSSLVSQREIGTSAINYTDALRAVLREDPDVIMIGELWEPEDIKQVLKISETGHLVIAGINTIDCTKAVERLVDAFPLDEHNQIRIMVSEALVGVISQRLIARADGRGRVLASEVLLATSGLAATIREGKYSQISSIIQTGGDLGMQSMDQSLVTLLEKKLITLQAARVIATDERFFKRAGINFDS